MQTFYEVFILSLVQGITEFFPISSSTHIALIKQNMYLSNYQNLTLFLILHLGTTFSVICYFWKDLFAIVFGFFCSFFHHDARTEEARRWIFILLLISVFTVLVPLSFFLSKRYLNFVFTDLHTGLLFLITAAIILSTRFFSQGEVEISKFKYWQAICLGLIQGTAVFPGISRSGVTISLALIFGASPRFAAQVSYFASFLVIFGTLLGDMILTLNSFASMMSFSYFFMAFFVSFFFGLLTLRILISILQNRLFYLFSIYCFLLGIFIIHRHLHW